MTRQISIRLPVKLMRALDRAARKSKRSRSEVIREAVAHYVSETSGADNAYDRVSDLLGTLSGGPADLGERHRDYLIAKIREGSVGRSS